jgi:hypothetical protein
MDHQSESTTKTTQRRKNTLEFIVRILFTGMMVFVPNSNGTQVDVILLNVSHGQQLSDGTGLPHHKPIILTRAGNCTGTCPKRDAAIASYVYGDLSTDAAKDALENACAGGGAWEISGGEISLAKGSSGDPSLPALSFTGGTATGAIPTTSAERAGINWLAKLSEICPNCGFNSDLLDADPPSNLVAARFRLNTGNVFTYSVARIGSDVTPVKFKRLDGQGSTSSYSQAIATWIGADITVSADSIQLVESKFDNSTGRTMTLTPDSNGRVEIAVLNLPQLVPSTAQAAPGVGKHFERYYDIAANPPSAAARLVPVPGAASGVTYPQVSWSSVHPQTALWSDLLNALRLNPGRSAFEITLCPPLEP